MNVAVPTPFVRGMPQESSSLLGSSFQYKKAIATTRPESSETSTETVIDPTYELYVKNWLITGAVTSAIVTYSSRDVVLNSVSTANNFTM